MKQFQAVGSWLNSRETGKRMRFWNIDALKGELFAGALSESTQFKYAFAMTILYTALIFLVDALPGTEKNFYDNVSAVLNVVLVAIGTYYVYRCNGGAGGTRFLEIYISVGWVVGIRFTVLFIFALALYVYVEIWVLGRMPETTTPGSAVFSLLLTCFYYYLFARHVTDLRRHLQN